MINRSLPWNYDFKFVVEEISNINDKAQVSRKDEPKEWRFFLLNRAKKMKLVLWIAVITNGICAIYER